MQKCIDGFPDIDECKENHSCHVNAICTNAKGSYVCTCNHITVCVIKVTDCTFYRFTSVD